jgi:ribosomal protein S18 acetylase RimI-like enzyme
MNTQKPTIETRQATISDLSLIVPLFDGYRQFYKQASDLEGARRFLATHFEKKSSVIFLAFNIDAEGEQQACGFTQLYPSFSSVSMKPFWILNDLFVAPNGRRLGVGRALLARAKEFACETQAKGLTLKTAVDNSTAQALYEAAGWKRDGQFYSYDLYL